jgi:Mycoplasma protein of unknown function, DUF285
MVHMFSQATVFEGGDLSAWKVGKVQGMSHMFRNARLFNGSISTWNTSSLSSMTFMVRTGTWTCQEAVRIVQLQVNSIHALSLVVKFAGASSFNGDLSKWNVSLVSSMSSVFQVAASFVGGDLTAWDTSRVVDMGSVFVQASSFTGNVSTWNVSSVQFMTNAFWYCYEFHGDLKNWDTSNVVSTERMFKDTRRFNADLSLWNMSKNTNAFEMVRFRQRRSCEICKALYFRRPHRAAF